MSPREQFRQAYGSSRWALRKLAGAVDCDFWEEVERIYQDATRWLRLGADLPQTAGALCAAARYRNFILWQ